MGGHKEDAGRASQPDIRAGEGYGADHPEVLSHSMCRTALGSGRASTGL